MIIKTESHLLFFLQLVYKANNSILPLKGASAKGVPTSSPLDRCPGIGVVDAAGNDVITRLRFGKFSFCDSCRGHHVFANGPASPCFLFPHNLNQKHQGRGATAPSVQVVCFLIKEENCPQTSILRG